MFCADSFSETSFKTKIPIQGDLDQARVAFQTHEPVLIHDFDDREGETDLVFPAAGVTPQDVAWMRNDAGGLICVALPHDVATAFNLPFLSDEITHPSAEDYHLAYDERSSFSIPVNHRKTFTGITDADRALTITKLAEAAIEPENIDFASEFHSPGHVPLLKGAKGLLSGRRGHTELGLALAAEANCVRAVVVCEMLDDKTGRSLSKEGALRYARQHNLPFITGQDILEMSRRD